MIEMASLRFLNFSVLVHFAITFLVNIIPTSSSQGLQLHLAQPRNHDHAALFIFGDSLFDAGNNNYINTTTRVQANVWPYGETFFKKPTGRFSDGRLIPDFIAEYAGLPFLPPYKQPDNHEFTNGANFASAGGGALAQTNQGEVIDLNTQLTYFKKVEKLLEEQLGDEEAKKVLSRAVYLFSIGSNDYVVPFLPNSTVFQVYSPEEYVEMVIGNVTAVIQEIYMLGGRKFGFVSLGPLGCLPLVKARNNGECMGQITALVKLHNIAFSKALQMLEMHLEGFKYSNFDFNATTSERMDNPSKYGFKEGKSACCGTGPYHGANSCGGKRGVKEFELCSNPKEYVFFDAAHPTEMVNQQCAELMWSGSPSVVWPFNLKQLYVLRVEDLV